MTLAADLPSDPGELVMLVPGPKTDLLDHHRSLGHGAVDLPVTLLTEVPVAQSGQRLKQWFKVGIAVTRGGVPARIPAEAGTRRGPGRALPPEYVLFAVCH